MRIPAFMDAYMYLRVCVYVYLRLMMKTVTEISSKIPTPLTDRSKKAEFTFSPIRGKGSNAGRYKVVNCLALNSTFSQLTLYCFSEYLSWLRTRTGR